MSTDQVVCKVAKAVRVKVQEDDIEISHRIKQKEGNKPVLAKFLSHKIKSKVYKSRINSKIGPLQIFFPGASWKLWNTLVKSLSINCHSISQKHDEYCTGET